MNEFDPIADVDPARPECAAAQEALQRLLDGEAEWDSGEAAGHRASCVACREELTLARTFSRTPPAVVVPAELAPRILSASLSAHRRRRIQRWAAAGLALAASVVIAIIVLRPPQPVQPDPERVVSIPPAKPDPDPPIPQKPLGDSVSEARDAFVSLTKRTATEPRDRISQLMPEPKLPNGPDAGEGLEPLADARTGAARSVEPMRDSARRAVNFFLRAADPPSRNVQ